MTTQTQTLTDFLLARIAEDEAVAQRAGSFTPWAETFQNDNYGHLTIQPARVLAECASKRAIVEAFEEERVRRDIYNRGYDDGLLTTNDDLRQRLASNAECRGMEIALRALASVYADHPDYRDEWRA